VRELEELASGVGSSTMPHKSNPTLAIEVVTRSREVSAHLPVLLEWMLVVHERDSAHNDRALERITADMANLLSCMTGLLDRVRVHPENMRRNLERTRGLIMTESLTQRLAPGLGRRSAHHAIQEIAREAVERDQSIFAVLREHPNLAALLGEIDERMMFNDYGLAPSVVDRTLAALESTQP
jgi:adenylosuccinate lyase